MSRANWDDLTERLKATITPELVREAVETIAALTGDDEAAHGCEDTLYFLLLGAIAEGRCTDPARCAAEAVKTNDLDFGRWCA